MVPFEKNKKFNVDENQVGKSWYDYIFVNKTYDVKVPSFYCFFTFLG